MLLAGTSVLTACAGQTVLLDNPPIQSNPAARTFDQQGVSFQYPGTWLTSQLQATPGPSASGGQPAPVQPKQQSVDIVGLDDLNKVTLVYGISGLKSEDFVTWSQAARADLAKRLASGSVTLLEGPHEIRAAGFPALRYETREASGLGYVLRVTWVGFVRRTTQFVITCTSIPERSAEIQRGCEQILATLHID
jgi:hypothetical protein